MNILEDIEQKIVSGMVTTDDLKDILNQEPTKNSTAIYVRELITNGNISCDDVKQLVNKWVHIEESETARLINEFGE